MTTSFSDGFWNIFIILITVGGLVGLYLLATLNSGASTAESSADGEAKPMGHVWDGDLEELNNPLPRWWVMMFYLSIVFAALYLVLYPGFGSNPMLKGWTQIKQYEEEMAAANERYGPIFEQYAKTPIPELAKDGAALAIGERLFASYCTVCHGSDAGGVTGFPNLRDKDWLWGGKPEQIVQTILDGRNGVMPPWKAALQDEGVAQVVAHVKSLSGNGPANAEGQTKFMQFCVACHGPDGKGNQMLGAPNLTDSIWLYGSDDAVLTQTIAEGRKGQMPAHREFLGEAKVHLLSAYIWSLSNN